MPGCGKGGKPKAGFPLFPRAPWESRQKPARFPHSHSSGDEGGWKSGNQKQVSHFPTDSIPLSTKEQNRSAGGLRPPPPAALRSASVVSFYSAVVGNFLSALDRRQRHRSQEQDQRSARRRYPRRPDRRGRT